MDIPVMVLLQVAYGARVSAYSAIALTSFLGAATLLAVGCVRSDQIHLSTNQTPDRSKEASITTPLDLDQSFSKRTDQATLESIRRAATWLSA